MLWCFYLLIFKANNIENYDNDVHIHKNKIIIQGYNQWFTDYFQSMDSIFNDKQHENNEKKFNQLDITWYFQGNHQKFND